MRQFSICSLKRARPSGRDRLVIVLQHDLLADLRTRVVAPLVDEGEVGSIDKLTPEIEFQGKKLRIRFDQLVTVDIQSLGSELGRIDVQDVVMRSIDLLFTGF
ncbi:CcdB family protein [uncultured Enterovirga sp.]|uniref:CcdB family protein n=1 Tax=uncultured Enterovirga sp. TaxID=2026352 RepID=UPI0035C98DA3